MFSHTVLLLVPVTLVPLQAEDLGYDTGSPAVDSQPLGQGGGQTNPIVCADFL